MTDVLEALDCPAVNQRIFFPRPDSGLPPPEGSIDLTIDVGGGVRVAARFYPTDTERPTILHFHGNGEIVADYDDLAPIYHAIGASLICADYRGYGRSTGQPSIKRLVRDAHPILDAAFELLDKRQHRGPLAVMGRSLGSAAAIELGANGGRRIAGLIIESGFAQSIPLLELLGVDVSALGASRVSGDDNEDKMGRVTKPTLILHAEHDTIIPPWNAKRNFERAASIRKHLVMVPNADHNNIIAIGGEHYWGAIASFLKELENGTA